jgi:hypothetical protein
MSKTLGICPYFLKWRRDALSDQKKVYTNGQWYSLDAIWARCDKCGKPITMGEAAYGDANGRLPGALCVGNLGHQVCGACAENTAVEAREAEPR